MAKKISTYYERFNQMASIAHQASSFLLEVLKNFDSNTFNADLDKMHEWERQSGKLHHETKAAMRVDFVTPIDRDDIGKLSRTLDSIVDMIDDVLIRIYMYNIKEISTRVIPLTEILQKCCSLLCQIFEEFPNYQKTEEIKEMAVTMSAYESDADKIYINATRDLYAKHFANPLKIATWSKLLDSIERCCDACEYAAETVDLIVISNS